ncbi:DUF2027 domain-containing protein [Mangrovibacterium marinum]|uniref:Smr domain-containing protein n=1 Tax=Mangrovibacterium marinum TaxID=1639118 RepID=A0A2T5BXG0_9BACT|nr:DUF2027 domain-containing protein [Mangrovibacterium marinum]PTN05288.1 Smr domain-containing protein [Mangrovibacterium marinum]
MYQVGDRVKFMNDVGGGIITKIVGKNMVHVENEDGFEIPVMTSEIILDEIDQEAVTNSDKKPDVSDFIRRGTQKPKAEERKQKVEEPITIIRGNDEPKFYLAFLPENARNPLDGQTKVYLVNDSNFFILYHFSHFANEQYVTQEAGKLEPNTKLMLGTLSQADIANLPAFGFQLMFYKDKSSRLEKPLRKRIAINPVKFYKSGSFKENDFFSGKAMLYKLNESDMEKAMKELTNKELKKQAREKEPARNSEKVKVELPELLEVDLHIDELIDNTAGLSNKDMLDLQMKTFREKMEEAISSNAVKRVVFIHGLGNGVLKAELRRELSSKYKKYAHQDASFQEYGYGATMVIVRR